jgi:putative membrane-bound dehydrogenase-like protein
MTSSRTTVAFCFLAFVLLGAEPPQTPTAFPNPTNSEKTPYRALSPEEAIRQLKLPPGFVATVFAAEPDVQQPIAFQFDPRGRLWVAEGYTYAEQALNYDLKLKDRIVIFEDTDNDGVFDVRKVFWEGSQRLTGLEIGFDGVYALTLPEMIFLPDRDHDDRPDSDPEILLDGFDHERARHTMANGLAWGPDGWLYGRQGILGTSLVGKPGTPQSNRVSINVGIWRFHPLTRQVEIVTSGTTNPWGMDWNAYGEAFHINTVIGHLWHVIPGAHFRRMFGEDPMPNVYQSIEQHADHVHWDTKELWSDIRSLGVTPTTSQAGGGHAHTGLMIYQGDNWPAEYRGDVFTINFHGRRLNRDRLETSGSGYVAKHRPDFAQFGDPWFRGIDLKYGPDGGVFVADWSDTGECHDHDGVHRVSGRIYKITYGKPKRPAIEDIRQIDQSSLLVLLEHANEWYARQARLEIQRRSTTKNWDAKAAESVLAEMIRKSTNPVHQVRGLFALHSARLDEEGRLLELLDHPNVHVRIWAVRFLTDKSRSPTISDAVLKRFAVLASETDSPQVRLALASALQHIPIDSRVRIAERLVAKSEDVGDHNLPMMLWYGVEPLGGVAPTALAELFEKSRVPLVRQWIVRRLTQDDESRESDLNRLLSFSRKQSIEVKVDLMKGMTEAMAGRRRARKPADWDAFAGSIDSESQTKAADLARNLSAFFGDGIALEAIRAIALDPNRDLATRRNALRSLIEARSPQLRDDCRTLFLVRDLSATAAEGLATFDDPALADEMIGNFGRLYGYERAPVIATLIMRSNWANKVLEAVENGKIRREEISASMARQIRSHRDAKLTARLNHVWGTLRETSADRIRLIQEWKSRLTAAELSQADVARGRSVFQKSCGNCHKMYGEGGASGPELTGSGRDDLDYLLSNILDPSGQVPANYRMSDLAMKDGRLLSGIVTSRTPKTLTLQTATEIVVIDVEEIEQVRASDLSLMPEGLLQNIPTDEVRDLIGFLMKK